MRRLFSTIIAAAMAISGALAQSAPLVLGKSHAMQRVEVKSRYLLLPVQEREDNATIKVLSDNQQVQKLNVRLAVDKVDYYVPLDIQRFGSSEVLLDFLSWRPSFHWCHEGFPLLEGDEAERYV